MDSKTFPLEEGFVIDDHGQEIAHHILSGFRLLKDDYIKYLYSFNERKFSFPNFNVMKYPKYIFYYNENGKLIEIINKILSLNQNDKIMTAINFYREF